MPELVARHHASEVCRRFHGHYASSLRQHGQGVTELIERWLAREDASLVTCWNEVFSSPTLIASGMDNDAAVHRGVSLAVHLSASGEPGEWRAHVRRPVRYRWGQVLLPAWRSITVRSDGSEAVLAGRGDGEDDEIRLMHNGVGWLPESGSPATSLPQVGSPELPILLLARTAAGEPLADSLPPRLEAVPQEIVSAWQEALAFIRTYAPIYAPWVQRVVRQIALLEATPGLVHSGSYGNRHGFIHASAWARPISLAEVLVHEASHQYFYLLSCLGPVDDGTDDSLYYSPLVDRKRPLNRILFAYHACANILRFYRLSLANGAPDDGYCATNEPVVTGQLAQLGAALRGNPALTQVGRTFYPGPVAIAC